MSSVQATYDLDSFSLPHRLPKQVARMDSQVAFLVRHFLVVPLDERLCLFFDRRERAINVSDNLLVPGVLIARDEDVAHILLALAESFMTGILFQGTRRTRYRRRSRRVQQMQAVWAWHLYTRTWARRAR